MRIGSFPPASIHLLRRVRIFHRSIKNTSLRVHPMSGMTLAMASIEVKDLALGPAEVIVDHEFGIELCVRVRESR
jgi:hypothetical protein